MEFSKIVKKFFKVRKNRENKNNNKMADPHLAILTIVNLIVCCPVDNIYIVICSGFCLFLKR